MAVLFITLAILIIDQLTKFLVLQNFQPGESLPVIKNIFHLSLILNKGVAFGLFSQSSSIFIWSVLVCALVAVLLLIFSGRILQNIKFAQICLSLILGGAAGNLIDRIRFGYVIDFLDFRIWPVFNVADSAITIGTVLLLLQILKHKSRKF